VNAERHRLKQDQARQQNWKRWGPYLSERQWGTVREDYSADGDTWNYFLHDQARSRAYRWGEDGLLGITDRECRLCFALALWNGKDPILKERLFGLTGPEGNHGEDCKELYYYLDSSPTHSYLKALYKYPQAQYPYEKLKDENARRGYNAPEYELLDTGALAQNRYFDVQAEYAKASPDDIYIKITVSNCGPEPASIDILPTLWFRNTWIWGCEFEGCTTKPSIWEQDTILVCKHETLGTFYLQALNEQNANLLFTENETNTRKLWNAETYTPYTKDAFHEYVIWQNKAAVNPAQIGTKAAFHYRLSLEAGQTTVLKFRLFADNEPVLDNFKEAFEKVFQDRIAETDQFYDSLIQQSAPQEAKNIQRQAYAGLLWSKQFYHYSVFDWLKGDPQTITPPPERLLGRNRTWQHLFNRDVISMPDKWEYPWYAAWDLAFHMIPFAALDAQFAKGQLLLLLREWYMHPNGQIPAYEFAFSDVNPPVHAWACWRVYKMAATKGERDLKFLQQAFHKLLINFTWWVNRKDPEGNNVFAGGFLGLDNIGVFDRSKPLPTGGYLHQADGTAWMAFYCATMLSMALELANHDSAYEDIASKFFEHFVAIADAINGIGGYGLWDETDGFYYDQLSLNGDNIPLRVRSMVGLVPLFAVETLEDAVINKLPGFKKRMNWFQKNRPDLAGQITWCDRSGAGQHLLAIPSLERLKRVLNYLLQEAEFMSEFGIRSVSKFHEAHPYSFWVGEQEYKVAYTPGESDSGLFGGNSNWRGPIWFPVNYLLIEALEKYDHFYKETIKIECPSGSGRFMSLKEVSKMLSERLAKIFMPNAQGARPCHGNEAFYLQQNNKNLVLFYEYFHGENGRGVGASHQTGWTGLIAKLLQDLLKTN
jgi:hypothetical protein